MNITMLGTGYVGLVSGTCFSEFGFNVCCVDKDKVKINNLINDVIPIYEPGLNNLVKKNKDAGRLSFSNDINQNIKKADIIFIAVGTPARRGDGHADLTYVYEAAEQIAKNLEGYTVIVTKSTVPVGTGLKVKEIIRKINSNALFDVVSNPEFLREGNAIEDFMRPDRIIVGLETEKAKEMLSSIYKPLYLIETPILFTDINTAELIKYSANAFLAVKISYINQMSDLCEKVGADVHDVARGIGLDKRIGNKFLHPGPGYGGSCFPKDTSALVQIAKENNANVSIVETVVKYNQQRKFDMAEKNYKKAIELKPDFAEAYYNLGVIMQEVGKLGYALECYKQTIRINSNHAESYYKIANLLESIKFKEYVPGMSELICQLLDKETFVRPKLISKAIISLLKFDPIIKSIIKKHSAGKLQYLLQETLVDLSNIPLLLKLMKICPLPDLQLEAVFKSIRSAILLSISKIPEPTLPLPVTTIFSLVSNIFCISTSISFLSRHLLAALREKD